MHVSNLVQNQLTQVKQGLFLPLYEPTSDIPIDYF